ncbi:hypothetical protein KHA94_13460 [Bacillus sp. FJAT-49705]|uniref:DUF3168 domain-containing protein n=1 Tax=Cytobacillus citreus TaxID=2833586 RepID=A0ABS5NTM3_9BACI|nr:hypothetical protein [Cytobacillus citreus]MBS4191191.1 hypothetical protein [Cytobacillus citreus]
MIILRKKLMKLLKLYHPQVYFQKVPHTAQFPYIVFNLPNAYSNEQQEVFNLDVDIWDNRSDTSELESLASKLWKELNYYKHTDDHIQFSIYRENRLPSLDEDDTNIKRRKLIFQLRYFDRRLFE